MQHFRKLAQIMVSTALTSLVYLYVQLMWMLYHRDFREVTYFLVAVAVNLAALLGWRLVLRAHRSPKEVLDDVFIENIKKNTPFGETFWTSYDLSGWTKVKYVCAPMGKSPYIVVKRKSERSPNESISDEQQNLLIRMGIKNHDGLHCVPPSQLYSKKPEWAS